MSRRGVFQVFIAVLGPFVNAAIAQPDAPPVHFSVLVTEFLPDPDPSAGLPAASFIELKNVSSSSVSLHGWGIGNGKTTAEIGSETLLLPDSFMILCPAAAETDYAAFGNALGVKGFPALSHVSGEIVLTGADKQVIDAVSYDRSAFDDPVKAEGGWSLARIDITKPCLGASNWTASHAPAGGTPGRANDDVKDRIAGITDESGFSGFIRSYCPDSTHILLLSEGPVDIAGASDLVNYKLSPAGINLRSAVAVPPFFDRILLELDKPLAGRQIYRINVTGISSCGLVVPDASLRTGLAETADSGDILFNEILFNPPSGGSDYIELYHAGKFAIDLQYCQLGSRDNSGSLKDPRPMADEPWLLFPDDYVVVTEDKNWVQQTYLVKNPGQLLQLAQLPSMPDDRGTVVLLNRSGERIDELPYDHQWHSPLIADESGVALEKTGLTRSSSLAANWTSAASTSGYGTPTYANSESDAAGYDSSRSAVTAAPSLFSPDNDGYNDFCFVSVKPGMPGFTANIAVYDIHGIQLKKLAANATLGTEGKFRWDGLDDLGNQLPTGRYVLFTEIFSLQGSVRRFKNVVVLARGRRP